MNPSRRNYYIQKLAPHTPSRQEFLFKRSIGLFTQMLAGANPSGFNQIPSGWAISLFEKQHSRNQDAITIKINRSKTRNSIC
jgi:hypothetical protein